MKYLKKFENLNDIAYSVGDIVVCVAQEFDTVGSKYKVKRILKDTISEGHIPYINALIDSEKGGEYSAHWGTFEVVERTPKIIKPYGIVKFMKEISIPTRSFMI